MIIGIGTDVTLISRIAQTYDTQGARFLNRCFTEAEAAYILSAPTPLITAARMAKRWAAKEACAKALGCGISGDVTLKDIEVRHNDQGCPVLYLHAGAQHALEALIDKKHIPQIHVSLSDDGDIAQAFVVLSAKSA